MFLDQDFPNDPSPEHVAMLQRGPVVIKEALREIDAVIDNSVRLVPSSLTKIPLGVELSEDVREFVREYEHPLESMLPLSRTTDSWGDDISISQVDDDVNRQSRDFESFSSGIGPSVQTTKGVRRSRSQEAPELDTIREVPCSSNAVSAPRSGKVSGSCHPCSSAHSSRAQDCLGSSSDDGAHEQGKGSLQTRYADENRVSDVPERASGDDSRSWCGPETHTTLTAHDRMLEKLVATGSPLCNDMGGVKFGHVRRGSDEERDDVCVGTCTDDGDCKRNYCNGAHEQLRPTRGPLASSHLSDTDLNRTHFRSRENGCQSCGASKRNDRYATNAGPELKASAAHRQAAVSAGLVDAVRHVPCSCMHYPPSHSCSSRFAAGPQRTSFGDGRCYGNGSVLDPPSSFAVLTLFGMFACRLRTEAEGSFVLSVTS